MNTEETKRLTEEMRIKMEGIRELMTKATSSMTDMQPDLIKDVEIDGQKAKLTLLKNKMINIVFEQPEQGKIFYDKW